MNVESRFEAGCVSSKEREETMKPSCERNAGRRGGNLCRSRTDPRFRVTDCDFQVFALGGYYGGSTGSSPPAFLKMRREYFRDEARRNFVVAGAFFFGTAG